MRAFVSSWLLPRDRNVILCLRSCSPFRELQVPEDLEEVRGRVNEVRRKAEGKEQNTFVVTDQTETSAGHGHLCPVLLSG